MKVKTMFMSRRKQRGKSPTFPHPDIAAHSMKPDGYVAGSLDDVQGLRLTGWIFNAANPNNPAKLRLLINGKVEYEFMADIFRQDIAILAGNNGLNGFEFDLRNLRRRDNVAPSIKFELVDNVEYFFGPIVILPATDWSSCLEGQHTRPIDGSVEDQLERIFTHITATLEESRQRLARLQGSAKTMQKFPDGSSAAGLRPSSNLAQCAESAISGIGAFHSTDQDEFLERELMAHRIEAQLSKIMLYT